MRRLTLLACFSLLAAFGRAETAAPSTSTVNGVTLAECYQKALRVSESLAMSEENIRRLQAEYQGGVGAVLPHIAWVKTQFYQDTPEVGTSSGGVQGTLLRANRPESKFTLSQTLFAGFRNLNVIGGAKVATSQSRHLRDQAAINVLADLANVFYTALDLQQEIDALTEQRRLTNDHLKELQRRVRLGKSRDSEVLSDEVQLASLDAQIEETKRTWYVARATLEFLTEVPPNVPLREDRPLPTAPSVEEALKSTAKRPDLIAADENRRVYEYRLRFAKGDFLPTLDVNANYYTERVGFQEDVKWDALFTLDVPIFSGFQTVAAVKRSHSDLVLAELEQRRLHRQARREIETAVNDLSYALTQAKFYERAVELGTRNYEVQRGEYRLGLTNNLEVLGVLTTLQDLKIRKLRADAAVRLNDIRLRVAMGQAL